MQQAQFLNKYKRIKRRVQLTEYQDSENKKS